LSEAFKYRNRLNIVVLQGDITALEVDAIVNPANSYMIMGGGVAGVIKRKGGEVIEREARKSAPVPVGKAVATQAGKLKVKYVIHAPTMERPAMRTSREKVKLATKAALNKAVELGIINVAFPAMGAGVGGLSVDTSVKTILEAIDESFDRVSASKLSTIYLVAYREEDYRVFLEVVKKWMKKYGKESST